MVKKRPYLIQKVVVILLFATPLYGENKLDLGAEFRLRGIQINNPTFSSEQPLGTGKTIESKYYSQRARVYLKGKLSPGIEIGTVLQAISVVGSTGPLLNRYPKEDFSPFLENIYIQANEIHGWPINFTVGRQPYVWGSGLLISDDGLGFDGINLELGPFWGVRSHFLTAKVKEKIVGESDSNLNLAGLSYQWGIHGIKFGWIWELDRSGTPYSHLRATTPVTSQEISRQFFDLQFSGTLEKGAFYSAEYVIQKGDAKVPGQETSLSGSALTFEGGFDFIHPRYKRMVLAFVFMQGSGDNSASTNEDEKFNPSFGHKFDGLERAGYGEFFAATPYSFFNQDKLIVSNPVQGGTLQSFPYTNLFSGLRMFGFRGSVAPWESFSTGLEFYLYSAHEIPDLRNGAPTTITETSLGRELVIKANYTYAKKINFAIRWGKFFASKTLNDVGSTRIILEASGKF